MHKRTKNLTLLNIYRYTLDERRGGQVDADVQYWWRGLVPIQEHNFENAAPLWWGYSINPGYKEQSEYKRFL